MIDVSTKLVLSQTRERAAEYALELDNAPRWIDGVKSVEWKTPKPVAIHSKVILHADASGKKGITYQVILFEPAYAIRFKSTDATYPTEFTISFEDGEEAGTCKAAMRMKQTITGLSSVAEPLVKIGLKKSVAKSMVALKAAVERGG